MKLSRFTDEGVRQFSDALLAIEDGGDSFVHPHELALDETISVPVEDAPPMSLAQLSTRRELAEYISEKLEHADLLTPKTLHDRNLWAWLGAYLFDVTCPPKENGSRNPGKEYRHIPSTGVWHFYRHLVRGPVRIYMLFQADVSEANILLYNSPHTPGDFAEQLSSSQKYVMSRGIIGAATHMYFDDSSGSPKPGAGSKERKPGTLRRYLDVLSQLELTYDLQSMEPEELLEILPPEFDRFR